MKRLLYWLTWLGNPQGRRSYEAGLAKCAQLDFWVAEMDRLSLEFVAAQTVGEKLRLDAQFWVAAKRFEQEMRRR